MSRKKRVEWTDPEINSLLDCWEERVDDLRRAKRNLKIFEEISAKLHTQSITKSPQEVATKIANLTKKFRTEKHSVGPSGGAPSRWCFFNKINRIIGRFPCNDDSLSQETEIVWDLNDTEISNLLTPTQPAVMFASTPMYEEEPTVEIIESELEDMTTSQNLADCTPSTSNRRKRRNVGNYDELMREIKRANLAAEKELRVANEIARDSLSIQRDTLIFFKSLQN